MRLALCDCPCIFTFDNGPGPTQLTCVIWKISWHDAAEKPQPNSQPEGKTDSRRTRTDICRCKREEAGERERECAALKGRAVGCFKSAAACAHFQLVSLRCLFRSCCCCRFQLQQRTRKSERRSRRSRRRLCVPWLLRLTCSFQCSVFKQTVLQTLRIRNALKRTQSKRARFVRFQLHILKSEFSRIYSCAVINNLWPAI